MKILSNSMKFQFSVPILGVAHGCLELWKPSKKSAHWVVRGGGGGGGGNGIKWHKMETFYMEKMEKPMSNSPFSPFYAMNFDFEISSLTPFNT